MFMRSCFVILSGVITAVAVLGWCRMNSDNQKPEDVVPEPEKIVEQTPQPTQAPEIIPIEEVEAPQDVSWIAPDELNKQIVEAVTNDHSDKIGALVNVAFSDQVQNYQPPEKADSVPSIKLVGPDVLPQIGDAQDSGPAAQIPANALFDIFKQDENVKSANTLAVMDLNTIKVLESSNPQAASDIAKRISDEGEPIGDGWVLYTDNQVYKRITWHCLDDSKALCLVSDDNVHAKLPDEQVCVAAQQANLFLSEQRIDSSTLLRAKNCGQLNSNLIPENKLLELSEDAGQLDVDGKSYDYAKTTMEVEGIDVISILPPKDVILPKVIPVTEPEIKPAPEIKPVQTVSPKPDNSSSGFSGRDIGIAGGAAVVMMLLGFLATRRRKEDKSSESDIENAQTLILSPETKTKEIKEEVVHSEAKSIAQELAEKESHEVISKTLEFVPKDLLSSDQDVQDLEQNDIQEIIKADEVVQEDENIQDDEKEIQELTREDIEDDLKEIQELTKDDLNEVPKEAEPEVQDEVQNLDALDALEEHPQPEPPDANRITAQATEKAEKLVEQDGVNAFLEALDDNWDEIADSFDAIMVPGQRNIENVKLKPVSQTEEPKVHSNSLGSVFDNDSDGESSLGMSGFLSSLQRSDRRFGDLDGSNPHTETKLKPIGHDTPKINSMPSVGPVLKMKSALNVSNDMDGMNGMGPRMTMPMAKGIKPQPVPELQEAAMDENSLYDALKRRARDISEMNAQQPKSGAFDFNKGLSKSGVFSVTGSRVDIDPSSDNEYFKSVYDKFVELQTECGESTDKLTLEQFVSRLAREKDNLMKRYHCKNVKFSVYVKDGKASLKAIPQK